MQMSSRFFCKKKPFLCQEHTANHHLAPLLCWPSPLAIAALLVLFSGFLFHKGDYLSMKLCFHAGFCHPDQFIVAHILRVGRMENQITEIYQKLLNAQGASTDRAIFPDSCRAVVRYDLQLPNFSGQACASIGKSSRCMGHSA